MLRIIEGYEMTGKSTMIRELQSMIPKLICWTDIAKGFGITSSKGDYGVGYTGSWIVGATVAHLGSLGVDVSNVILDRGIVSSMVYGRLKDNFDGEHLERYLDDLNDIGAEIVYLYHKDLDSARKIFESAQKDRKGEVDEYDPKNFDDYWTEYKKFDIEYMRCLYEIENKYSNITIRFVNTTRQEDCRK